MHHHGVHHLYHLKQISIPSGLFTVCGGWGPSVVHLSLCQGRGTQERIMTTLSDSSATAQVCQTGLLPPKNWIVGVGNLWNPWTRTYPRMQRWENCGHIPHAADMSSKQQICAQWRTGECSLMSASSSPSTRLLGGSSRRRGSPLPWTQRKTTSTFGMWIVDLCLTQYQNPT